MKMIVIALVLAASLARAEEHKVQVFIDGKEIEGAVLQPNGTIVLPPQAIPNPPSTGEASPTPPPAATALPIVSSVAPVSPPAAPPAPSVKGKLIWYHNVWDLKSPESGAHVWLLTETEAAALASTAGGTETEPIPSKATGWDSRLAKDYKFPHAVADESGKFFFDHVPPGRYVLIIKGVHCKWTTPRDRDGKMRFKPVEVGAGAPIDFTFDFGRTADALKR